MTDIIDQFIHAEVLSYCKSFSRYHIGTVFKSTNTLRSILTHTKTPTAAKHQKNVIYKIPCEDCEAFYIGQTCRPLIKRIKEHEACHRFNNLVDSATGNIKSAPAKHGRDLGHKISLSSTSIIATCNHRSQLDLLEHAAISTLETSMNIQHKGPVSTLAGTHYLTPLRIPCQRLLEPIT